MAAPKLSCAHQARPKKIIVCCDGTWDNSLDGDGTPVTNVTRISRVLGRECEDGTKQEIFYHTGVGTGGTWFNSITGGAFGMGLAEVCIGHFYVPYLLGYPGLSFKMETLGALTVMLVSKGYTRGL